MFADVCCVDVNSWIYTERCRDTIEVGRVEMSDE